jgi:hypothetical protein
MPPARQSGVQHRVRKLALKCIESDATEEFPGTTAAGPYTTARTTGAADRRTIPAGLLEQIRKGRLAQIRLDANVFIV